jgi:hypothetical protein
MSLKQVTDFSPLNRSKVFFPPASSAEGKPQAVRRAGGSHPSKPPAAGATGRVVLVRPHAGHTLSTTAPIH